jgi:hypothetical protein
LKTLACACASLLVVFLLLEAGLLSARYWRDGTFEAENSYDAEVGWVPTPNYRPRDRQVRDLAGNVRSRHYSTNEFGSRSWGTHPGHTKVLFIGDSGTQASDVSDDQTYYYYFAQLSSFDTYAIGASGYGTLQEKMLLVLQPQFKFMVGETTSIMAVLGASLVPAAPSRPCEDMGDR